MKIQGQPETDIYVGERGHIVIKQSNQFNEDDDQSIFISPEFAKKIIKTIRDLIPDAFEARKDWEEKGDN
jgi:hypothetical protein